MADLAFSGYVAIGHGAWETLRRSAANNNFVVLGQALYEALMGRQSSKVQLDEYQDLHKILRQSSARKAALAVTKLLAIDT